MPARYCAVDLIDVSGGIYYYYAVSCPDQQDATTLTSTAQENTFGCSPGSFCRDVPPPDDDAVGAPSIVKVADTIFAEPLLNGAGAKLKWNDENPDSEGARSVETQTCVLLGENEVPWKYCRLRDINYSPKDKKQPQLEMRQGHELDGSTIPDGEKGSLIEIPFDNYSRVSDTQLLIVTLGDGRVYSCILE